MNSERWDRLEALFHAAAARPPVERETFLAEACSDDILRAEVRLLLDQLISGSGTGPLDRGAASVPQSRELVPGERLGVYEIRGLLGAGGMGEVYRAFDSRLQRDVAIKVLPQALASDERVARFDREARVLAALNHPNVGAIYGLEVATTGDGRVVQALVLELIAGETLAERIARGALPVADAIRLAVQITLALEAAHENGIVHRDLKPANVKVTPDGTIKVLDFGLAAMSRVAASDDLSGTRTETAPRTQPGTILGTLAYMSPEQARGQVVDRRTDIWAFGCVLFEMLAGRRPFAGSTTSDLIAAILEREPDWARLPAATPVAVHRVLRWSLAKDQGRRLRDIADARLELETSEALWPNADSHRATRRPWIAHVAWAATAVVVAAASVAISRALPLLTSDAAPVSSRFAIPVGAQETLPRGVAMSPDGRFIAYQAGPPGNQRTFLRAIGEREPQLIAEVPLQAPHPFFSPDSAWVAYFDSGKLKKRPVRGGSPETLAEAPTPRGGTWGSDGSIVFAPVSRGGLMRIPPEGGQPEVLTTPDASAGETSHRQPSFLPNSRTVLFVADSTTSVKAISLDDRQVTVVLPNAAALTPKYLPTGHLAYLSAGNLLAVPFNPKTLRVSGSPVTVVEGVTSFSFSEAGTLVYSEAVLDENATTSIPVWTTRAGAVTPLPLPPANYHHPRLADDGRLVLHRDSPGDRHLFIYDAPRETLAKFTFADANNWPVWTPDGTHVIYASNRPGTQWDLVEKPADGSGPERSLLARPLTQIPRAISPSGDTLVFEETYPDRANALWRMPRRGPGEPRRLFDGAGEMMPTFSPDGRWLAYVSPRSARNEVYVRSSDGAGRTWQISSGGGVEPVWSASGRELFYRADDMMMVVDVELSDSPSFGKPRVLFEGIFVFGNTEGQEYDVARDGGRFLMLKPQAARIAAPLQVVVHWFDDVRRRVQASPR